ncbi:MAG: TatD family hydrolase [Actinomycetes bacterium]
MAPDAASGSSDVPHGPAVEPLGAQVARQEDTVDGPPEWIDNHCHVAGSSDLDGLLADAAAAGVVAMVDVACSVAQSEQHPTLLAGRPHVWGTVGVHPHEAEPDEPRLGRLAELLDEHPDHLVAVGECGLDYFYEHSPRDVQQRVFAAQVRLAHERNLPLVIHTRDAWEDTFALLAAEGVPRRTVFHCFTGGPAEAERCLDLGAVLSVSGIVTYASAGALREAVALAPLERLMVETDSPYLKPSQVKDKGRNRPALVPFVGQKVADVKDLSVAEVAAATTANARAFFALPGGAT